MWRCIDNSNSPFVASRGCEAAQFFRQEARKSYGCGVLPIRTHNLNPYRQSGFCLTDGRNRSWATYKCSWGSPVGYVEVGSSNVQVSDGALVLWFTVIVGEGSRESYRR